MARNRKKEVKLKKMLLVVWFIFILALVALGVIFYKKKDTVVDDLSFTTRFSYQTNANQDINALMITYLSALSSSDQATLQSCVTNPDEFNDMSIVQSQSKIITAYRNVNCYTVEGMDVNDTVVYVVSNVSIIDVESTPMDLLGPFYVVKKNGQYLIDNSNSAEITQYISKVNKSEDIQDLYKMVKDDEEQKAEQDPALKEFLERLNN